MPAAHLSPEAEKVLKLLNLTTSDSDGEALTAIRMANAILKKQNKTWESLFVIIYQAPKPPPKPPEPDIEEMLEVCMEEVRGSAREFIESLYDFYQDKGYLSEKQLAALKRFYANASR